MSYAHLVKPDGKVKLDSVDPDYHDGLSEEEALTKLSKLGAKMENLLDWLYAARQDSLLIVLQGRDTSGKDGAIRRFLLYADVQSTRVWPFKAPSPEESSHDFLWRIHQRTPGVGDVTIFNRSHYEDVIAARVHKLVPKKEWKLRYDQINAFEELLTSSGTIVLKFYLHITKDEQQKRLLAREDNPEKAWKLSVGDWKEREVWADTTEAYEDALQKCSPSNAPWRIVPANHKWFRDLAIIQAIVDELKPYEKKWKDALKERGEAAMKELEEYRAHKG